MTTTLPSHGARTTPKLWGHRGLGGTAFENTLAGFARALDQGAFGIELDVRPCASGELVVMHDADLARMAGRPERVSDLSLTELRAIRIPFSDQAIPTLAEAIALVRGRGAQLNIELKGDVPDIDAAVTTLHETLVGQTHAIRAGLLISSFDHAALAALSALGSHRLAPLFDAPAGLDRVPTWATAVHPHALLISEERMTTFRERGLEINVWTVNDDATATAMAGFGVTGLITDNIPALLATRTNGGAD